ncbi:PadR family transcriptional regulator [Halobiforma lacisalsi AJ5]|uniref:PadR family transcriptional regulator n=1 Tax=Natronobacterium lacisalsi AJ5 TaxID=358396 RepID=M0M0Z5_NATLA|nr:helix-turn-helix transcriptional regulator [Halobiforma lacisalsi]APW97401.1 PadR family transcriptional regulator [Halobiforma lacisalsi AJ5]EMA38304.1 PadR family transcriptional regulator [Halobiforma lacisalsi AJ5]
MQENVTSTESVLEELTRMTASRDRNREERDRKREGTKSGELGSDGTPLEVENGTNGAIDDVQQELDELVAEVEGTLPVEDVSLDEALIKENVEEVLLLLVALRGETHGKELLSDFSRLFDANLSPGTVYPSLHDLEEEDVLSMHAKVQTKEYSIADDEYVRETVEETMLQHLSFGLLLYAFLTRY